MTKAEAEAEAEAVQLFESKQAVVEVLGVHQIG